MDLPLLERIKCLDWNSIQGDLDENGFACLPQILTTEECDFLKALYKEEAIYRTTINMSRFRFGEGEYKYFSYPLPKILSQLREGFYVELAKTANRWLEFLNKPRQYPESLDEFLQICKQHNQTRPTTLILKYGEGGYNCLHQDLYGDVFFPFQVVFALSQCDEEYFGGEFMLIEQRPRAQSKGHAISINKGSGLIFPTSYRPIKGKKGYYKANVKHGVSTVRNGKRFGLGIIFHDSK